MKVCIGGTFRILHKGHKLLIDTAFEIAAPNGYVFIGLASGDLIKNKGKIDTLSNRKTTLEKYLLIKGYQERALIKPIRDKYGPAIDEEFDAIIVSPETKKTAEEINYKRRKKGKKPLKIIQIPFVLADDGMPISSSRIKSKEIDENGNILKRD